ncbi:MAG: acetate--CoA ligase family protein [Fidelibacterota bacterium]|nr:MAG: acetate--CoA ligase family protein [Candidatus Neomarinimicrobiota bacterium]
MTDKLEVFDCPDGVAVIGASRDPEKLGHGILSNILTSGYQGNVYPVNPKTEEVLGLPSYPSVKDIPDALDLAVIVIPERFVPDALRECGEKGLKAVIVITAGFGETGVEGVHREQEITAIAREYGLRVIGPNCLGVIDTFCPINASFAASMPDQGNIAFMSQSGALCTAVLDLAVAEGIGFSRFVSLGNKADVDEAALLLKWKDDEHTAVVLAYIEGLPDGREFINVARQVSARKPVVALKSGTTEAGSKAVSSHTGSLAGSEHAYEAAFQKAGVIRAESLRDIFDWGLAFAYQPLLEEPYIAIVTNAGGPGILATDGLERAGLHLAQLEATTVQTLREGLPGAANVYNPIDVLGDAGADRYALALKAALEDPKVKGVIVILTPQVMTEITETATLVSDLAGQYEKPIIGCFMGEAKIRAGAEILNRNRVPNFPSPDRAVSALQAMWDYRQFLSQPQAEPDEFDANREEVQRILNEVRADGRLTLGEAEARGVIAAYGIPLPESRLARTSEEAIEIAENIGFPVALKIASPDILHKSDIGGIRLDLKNANDVRDAFDLIMYRSLKHMPDAEIWGTLVQEMVDPGKEVIVGMSHDPQFGPLILFGLGGIYVEVLKDVAFRLTPITEREAAAMINEIRAAPLLRGVRGEKRSDVKAITEIIQRVSQLVMEFPEIVELDINPLVVHNEGAIALDARLSIDQRDS